MSCAGWVWFSIINSLCSYTHRYILPHAHTWYPSYLLTYTFILQQTAYSRIDLRIVCCSNDIFHVRRSNHCEIFFVLFFQFSSIVFLVIDRATGRGIMICVEHVLRISRKEIMGCTSQGIGIMWWLPLP